MEKFIHKHIYYIAATLIFLIGLVGGILIGSITGQAVPESKTTAVSDEADHIVSVMLSDKPKSLGEFKLTTYCTCSECCDEYADGYTATMTEATPGRTIAVDPNVIPYGTKVIINGNIFVAEDCGEAIKGNRIDVLCASHELAEQFGVQYAEVYIANE